MVLKPAKCTKKGLIKAEKGNSTKPEGVDSLKYRLLQILVGSATILTKKKDKTGKRKETYDVFRAHDIDKTQYYIPLAKEKKTPTNDREGI